MSSAVQSICPGCGRKLIIPANYLSQSFRCKNCGQVLRHRPKSPDRNKGGDAPIARPVPPPELPGSASAHEASAFDFHEDDAGGPRQAPMVRSPRRRKKSRSWLVVPLLLAGLGLAVGAGGIALKRYAGKSNGEGDQAEVDGKKKRGKDGETRASMAGDFPRRALVVSIHNYLFANPVGLESREGSEEDRLLKSLQNNLRIPAKQVFLLSDAPRENSVVPWKAQIESALEQFVKTSRAQDRIMVFLIGHIREVNQEAFFVPLEGEMDNPDTMIRLKSLVAKLAECPARQKVLVIDGNRFNPGQGEERPAPGPMSPAMETFLKAPPEGVEIWASCSSGQQSLELLAPLGLFLDGLRMTLASEPGRKSPLEGKIQKPGDPIPVRALNDAINQYLLTETERRKIPAQTSFVAGNPPTSGADPDPSEEPARPLQFAEPGDGSSRLAREILSQTSLPPFKGDGSGNSDLNYRLFPPFSDKDLKEYGGEEADSPLRKAVEEARLALWAISTAKPPRSIEDNVKAMRKKLGIDLSIMRESYDKPGGGEAEATFKTRVAEDSRAMAPLVARLENMLDSLTAQAPGKKDGSRRLRADYFLVTARLNAQLAYLEEYQGLLGQIRRDLPAHDANLHIGFRMASSEKPNDSAGKKLEKNARKLYSQVITENPGTPWEIIAKRERLTALGLTWKAY